MGGEGARVSRLMAKVGLAPSIVSPRRRGSINSSAPGGPQGSEHLDPRLRGDTKRFSTTRQTTKAARQCGGFQVRFIFSPSLSELATGPVSQTGPQRQLGVGVGARVCGPKGSFNRLAIGTSGASSPVSPHPPLNPLPGREGEISTPRPAIPNSGHPMAAVWPANACPAMRPPPPAASPDRSPPAAPPGDCLR